MRKKSRLLTSVIIGVGLVFAWLPLVAPVVFTVLRLVGGGDLRFDYLMPAELFPIALTGGLLLLWAAVRERRPVRVLAGGLAAMLAGLVGAQYAAVATGLAHGYAEPVGWRLALVAGLLGVYTLGVITVAVTGVVLARHRTARVPAGEPEAGGDD